MKINLIGDIVVHNQQRGKSNHKFTLFLHIILDAVQEFVNVAKKFTTSQESLTKTAEFVRTQLENLDVDSTQIAAVMDLLATSSIDFTALLCLDSVMGYASLDIEKAAKILGLTKLKIAGIVGSIKQYL
jgi:predicted ferric reductase